MSTGISSATALTPAEIARRKQLATPSTTSTSAEPSQATTTATVQAQQGAVQVQEPFNAPLLALPESPTTKDVLTGLRVAMADPDVNASSVRALSQLHDMILQADRAMIQAIMEGVRS